MPLREKINEKLKTALKNKDKTLVSTLRLILAAIMERDIAIRTGGKKDTIQDPEIVKVLQKMKKQRKDSSEMYKKGGRLELLAAEESEIKVIDSLLPKQLSEDEIKKICEETIKSLGVSSIKDIGKIMGTLKKKYSGTIDFSKVNVIVRGLLT